nr:metallothionein [Sporosarcina newyorkensis]
MEKCARPNCNCLVGNNKVEVDGKVYCCEICAKNCTDETCNCQSCDCEKAV